MTEEGSLLAVLTGIVLVIGFWFMCSIADHQPAAVGDQGVCTRSLPQNC